MKSITILVFADPGHAWGRVSLKQMRELNYSPLQISEYSHMRSSPKTGQLVMYLEEDLDLTNFINHCEKLGYKVKLRITDTNKQSRIRGYKRVGYHFGTRGNELARKAMEDHYN